MAAVVEMKRLPVALLPWLAVMLIAGIGAASAQQAVPQAGSVDGWQSDLGVGLIVNPEYQGGDRYRALAVPYFDVRHVDEKGTKVFFNVPQGAGVYVLRQRFDGQRRLALSVALAPGFQNRDPDELPGLDSFGTAIETRVGAEYDVGRFSLQGRVAQAVASGHEGLYADLSASYRFAWGRGAFAGVGPGLRVGGGRYMSALYGVTADESAASGLAAFDAGAGLESVALQGIVSVPLGERWRGTAVARLGRLVGSGSDSTLTVEPTQLFFVAALTRRFRSR